MFTVRKMNKIAPIGLQQLDSTRFVCTDEAKDPEGILVRSASLHEYNFDANPQLRAIARAGAGTNNIPIPECTERGIVVFNTPGANANAVKELVLAGLLLAARNVLPAVEWAKANLPGKGEEIPKLVEKGKGAFAGRELRGKKLGVIGLGAIGIQIANAAAALDMEVLGYDPYLTVEAAWRLSNSVRHVVSVDKIYKECDFITVHVPLTPDTRGSFHAEVFAAMKDGAVLLNFARGELVDTPSLKAALESGKLACYVTDFPGKDTFDLPNTIAIPHLGASTEEAEDNCAVMACRQMQDYFLNGNIVNSVNFPTVSCERSHGARICVLHRNRPGTIEMLSGILAREGVNIENITSKAKGDNAYTMIDTDRAEIRAEVQDAIRNAEVVMRVVVL